MKDICLLKYNDIQGEYIYFRRAKTSRTNRKSKPVVVIVTEEVKSIIEKWGQQPQHADTYIFPVLRKGLTPERQHALIKQATKQTRFYIKRIASEVGIKGKVHFQVARHSYATVLKRSGVSYEFISESLGHSKLSTTYHYLDSFEDDQKRETAKLLTAFKKSNKDKADQ
jgi:integrase